MTYNERIEKLKSIFNEYYKTYDGKFDEEFLCAGFARKLHKGEEKNSSSETYKFYETNQIQDWMKLIKFVSGMDYNFYDSNLNHYGFRDFSEYETKKNEIEKTIGLYEM